MKYIELIIFDLDGTLVDSKENIVNAVNLTLKKIGLREKDKHEISSYIGNGTEYLIKKSLGESGNTILDKTLSVFENYYREHPADYSSLYPNVKKMLEYFKDKKKVVITNGKYELALLALKSLNR